MLLRISCACKSCAAETWEVLRRGTQLNCMVSIADLCFDSLLLLCQVLLKCILKLKAYMLAGILTA